MTLTFGGRLKRARVTIQRPTKVQSGRARVDGPPLVIADQVAAEVLALSGSEAVREKILQGVRVYRVTVRWRGDVLQTDQLVIAGEAKPLNIRSAVDPTRRRRELVIIADTDGIATA